MVRKALGTFCTAVSLMKTRRDVPPLPPASPGLASRAPGTSGYKLALLVNYSIVLCKCFLTNFTFLGSPSTAFIHIKNSQQQQLWK